MLTGKRWLLVAAIAAVWTLAALAATAIFMAPPGASPHVAAVTEEDPEPTPQRTGTRPVTPRPLDVVETPAPALAPATEPTPKPAADKSEVVARTTWTGAADNRYDNPKNWDGGLPGATSDIIVRTGNLQLPANSSLGSVTIESGASVTAGWGTLSVSGDWNNSGTFKAGTSTVAFTGANQSISGVTALNRARFSGGTKRLLSGTKLSTSVKENAKPGEAAMVVEAGTTLIVDAGAEWTTSNAFGYQIAGTLIIDGGTFNCQHANGGYDAEREDSWLDGSSLILRSGLFKANGDADFSGASLSIQGGSLEVNDDIWNSGTSLEISGGSMRNATHGAMFAITGIVRMTGGKLCANQSGYRGLSFYAGSDVITTGGEIEVGGTDVNAGEAGIQLGTTATIANLTLLTSSIIGSKSDINALLTVLGKLTISKGKSFKAQGFRVSAIAPTDPEQGQFVP